MVITKSRFNLRQKVLLWLLIALLSLCSSLLIWGWLTMIFMPGKSYAGELQPLSNQEQLLQVKLRQDVEKIAGEIGEHNYLNYDNLVAVAQYLESSFAQMGYEVNSQVYEVNGQLFRNLEVEIPGKKQAEEIVVIGAHYDSVINSPGANDNGTGVAAVLALARAFANQSPARTLRFVQFVNEEQPFAHTKNMGSVVYAKGCFDRGEKVVGMLSLETMGYYSDQPGSQRYPMGLLEKIYPITGNFIAFVGNLNSRSLVRQVVGSFRNHAQFPSQGATLPDSTPGAGWSDHWSFWQHGYPGLMVTDTAPFRYPYYHTAQDTPDKIDYESFARVVAGLEGVIRDLITI